MSFSNEDTTQFSQHQEPERPFSLLISLPLEVAERIFFHFLNGKSLSTLAIVLHCACSTTTRDSNRCGKRQYHHGHQEQHSTSTLNDGDISTGLEDSNHLDRVSNLIHHVAKKRLLKAASFIESTSAKPETGHGTNDDKAVELLTINAVNWIRSVVNFSFLEETNPLTRMRVLSENLALLDLLDLSVHTYSDVQRGAFEWPVWVGQISVDSYVTGSRMRNTAKIVITSPLQSPGFLPGCNLIQKRTPSGIFRCEPYNMIPLPPWGRIRGLTEEDALVLVPVAKRLEQQSQVAVPIGYHSDEILDIRVASAVRARQLLDSMSWKPRGSWILQDPSSSVENEGRNAVNKKVEGSQNSSGCCYTGLVCVWQEDTMEMKSDRHYLTYVVDLLKAMDRMTK